MLKKLEKLMEKFLLRSDSEDKEFLPPAVEILEKPPSPAGRMLVWAIVGLFILALLWSFIGEIDEVVVARGKVIPIGYTKVLQAEDKGIVKRILVQEGQQVKEGELLMELDRTMSESDLNALKKEIGYYDINIRRIMAELGNKPFLAEVGAGEGYDSKDLLQQMSLYQSRQSEKNAKLVFYDAQIRQKEDAVRVAESSLEKNRQLLAIAREREENLGKIVEEGAVSKFAYLEYKGKRIELEQNVSMNTSELSAARADASAARQQKAQYLAEWNRQLQEELISCRKQYNTLKESERKAELKNKLIEIKSPADGAVHRLDIHTVGAVVTEAQALMEVVPKGTPMEVEAWMENKDVGFVYPNMPVEVKVDAFNFQKFGTIKGKVREISPDAIEDKERGQIYRVMVSIEEEKLHMDDKELQVTPGMAVSAEIKTRKKRIIDFFLEPFQTYKSEALRER
jgi:hemolysin D